MTKTPDPKTPEPAAAEAADAEANGVRRVLTIGDGDDAVTVEIPRKFKRLKFLRALRSGNTPGALDAIWPPTPIRDPATGEPLVTPLGEPLVRPHPEAEKLEDADLSEEELGQVIELIAGALGVETAGNSPASPTS